MSKLLIRLRKVFRTMLNEDIKIILAFSLIIFTIYHLYVLSLGWMIQTGLSYNTPSISVIYRSQMPDTDGDLLPDLVETTPRGEDVIYNGIVVGKGTGTNPNKRDTDNDLFTDSAEDNLGTDPTNIFSPGYLYLVWMVALVYYISENYRRGDQLKEYREFDEIQSSGGVASSGSKYAFGSSSVFAQKTKHLTDDDKQKLIESDPRYLQMMGSSNKSESMNSTFQRLKIKKRSFQLLIAILLAWIVRYVIAN